MTLAFYLAFFSFVVACWFLIPFGLRRLSEARLRYLCKAQRSIVLSYDDGPSACLTPRLLDLLSENKTKATFFILGRNADVHQELVARLLHDGHEAGSHTFDHTNAWKVWPWTAAHDLGEGITILRDHQGSGNLFRPPFGKLTLATLIDCLWRKLRLGWWTIDTQDTRNRRPIQDVLSELEAHGGGVILMHDLDKAGIPADGISHSDYVLSLTRSTIDFASKNGFILKRLSDVYSKVTP